MSNITKAVITRLLAALVILPAMIFLPAWDIRYWPGWLFLGVLLLPMMFTLAYFLKKDPALLERRLEMREKEPAQKLIAWLVAPVFLLMIIIPGFDYRLGWSSLPETLIITANAAVLLGYLIIIRVFMENRFAARTIRVEQGQTVISTGPYAVIRHPMYLGVLLIYGAIPLALGSLWAVLGFPAILISLIIRILNEEKVLSARLAGYQDYCAKIRYRLIPFIW